MERTFQEVTSEDGGIRAVLNLASIGEMNQIYQALTENAQWHPASSYAGRSRWASATGLPTVPASGIVSSGIRHFAWHLDLQLRPRGSEATPGDVWWEQYSLRRSTPCSPEATPGSSISARWTLMP